MDRAEKLYDAKQLHKEGLEFSRRRRWRLALETFEEALEIAREINDRKTQADILVDMGIAVSRLKSEKLDTQYEPVSLYEKALKIYRSIDSGSIESRTLVAFIKLNGNEDDLWMKADALSHMGVICEREARSFDYSEDSQTPIYDDQSKVEDALDYLQQALYIYQRLGYKAREWNIIFYIGKIYEAQNNEEKAKEAYLKVLRIAYEIDDIEAEIWIIHKTNFRQYFSVDTHVYKRWIGDDIPYPGYSYGAEARSMFSGGGN